MIHEKTSVMEWEDGINTNEVINDHEFFDRLFNRQHKMDFESCEG